MIEDHEVGRLWRDRIKSRDAAYSQNVFESWPVVKIIRKLVEERVERKLLQLGEDVPSSKRNFIAEACEDFGIDIEDFQ